MKTPLRVAIYPGGTENGLEILKSLRYCKEVNLISISNCSPNHAPFAFAHDYPICNVDEENWLDELNSVIAKTGIDIIFPANSKVIDALAKHKDAITCDVLLPNNDALKITRSKLNTYEVLSGAIPIPKLFSNINEVMDEDLPLFTKPLSGYGSQGAHKLEFFKQLESVDWVKNVVQEYLPGEEFTVDCFSDQNCNLLFASPRQRIRIRMGTSMAAKRLGDQKAATLKGYANLIQDRIPITGAWFFQMKEDVNGELKLLEVDLRIAGTMALNRCHGINFPLLSLFQHHNMPVQIMQNNYDLHLDRCLKNRYKLSLDYERVYVDLDDTLVVHGRLNLQLVKFLFQSFQLGKSISLLTKHLGNDVNAYLETLRIKQIFDEIIWIKETDSKVDYITDPKSVFIDDSFSQRRDVNAQLGIATFDASMVEALMVDYG